MISKTSFFLIIIVIIILGVEAPTSHLVFAPGPLFIYKKRWTMLCLPARILAIEEVVEK